MFELANSLITHSSASADSDSRSSFDTSEADAAEDSEGGWDALSLARNGLLFDCATGAASAPTPTTCAGFFSSSRAGDVRVRTYIIVPLTPYVGVIEWVFNTAALGMLLYTDQNRCVFDRYTVNFFLLPTPFFLLPSSKIHSFFVFFSCSFSIFFSLSWVSPCLHVSLSTWM